MKKQLLAALAAVVALSTSAMAYELPASWATFLANTVMVDQGPLPCPDGSLAVVYVFKAQDGDEFRLFASQEGKFVLARYPQGRPGMPDVLWFGTNDEKNPDKVIARKEKFDEKKHTHPCAFLTAKDA